MTANGSTPGRTVDHEAIASAARDAIAAIQFHVACLTEAGKPSRPEVQRSALDDVRQALFHWSNVVEAESGFDPLDFGDDDDVLDSDADHYAQGDTSQSDGSLVTVVSRFDLEVQDPGALLADVRKMASVGPEESPPIQEIVDALVHASDNYGQAWWSLAGVEVVSGGVAFIRPGEEALIEEPLQRAAEHEHLQSISIPDGTLEFFEGYTSS